MNFQTPHEKMCFETATSFSAVRGRGEQRTRETFNTFSDVLEHADNTGDGRTMIYAINEMGNSAHICNR
jgi:hypothetical protein